MTKITALFAKFGLFGRKETAPDTFSLRLMRIGTREGRYHQRCGVLFRNPL